MQYPTLHMNGTAPRDLFRECRTAMDGLSTAQEALAAMTVNGRDYYPQGDDAFTKARAEHVKRLDAIRCIREEIEKIAMHIMDNTPATGSLALE
jgi:hypothetical protein